MSYPTLAREFPDFPLDSLPAIPSHWHESAWHNDACPSFIIGDDSGREPGIQVFIDYADASKSEFPNWRADGTLKRFNAMSIPGNDGTEMDIGTADDWQEMLAHLIAWQFVENLRDQLTGAEFKQVLRENVGIAEGVCASHNVCDANMPMAEAFEAIMGRKPLEAPDGSEEHEADCRLWGAAWNIATPRYLTSKESE